MHLALDLGEPEEDMVTGRDLLGIIATTEVTYALVGPQVAYPQRQRIFLPNEQRSLAASPAQTSPQSESPCLCWVWQGQE